MELGVYVKTLQRVGAFQANCSHMIHEDIQYGPMDEVTAERYQCKKPPSCSGVMCALRKRGIFFSHHFILNVNSSDKFQYFYLALLCQFSYIAGVAIWRRKLQIRQFREQDGEGGRDCHSAVKCTALSHSLLLHGSLLQCGLQGND